MSQTAMTIRLDESTKKKFTKLCDEFGLSVNAAINVFIKAVVNSGEIPFRIRSANHSDINKKALMTWNAIRQRAEANSSPELTLEEINEEIRLARQEHTQKSTL